MAKISILLFVLLFLSISANAAYYNGQKINDNNYSVNSSYRLKHSDMVDWMENQNVKRSNSNTSSKKEKNKPVINKGVYKKTYKWF